MQTDMGEQTGGTAFRHRERGRQIKCLLAAELNMSRPPCLEAQPVAAMPAIKRADCRGIARLLLCSAQRAARAAKKPASEIRGGQIEYHGGRHGDNERPPASPSSRRDSALQ